jgi:L-asparagine oxygenase
VQLSFGVSTTTYALSIMRTSIADSLAAQGFLFLPEYAPGATTGEVAAHLGQIARIEGVGPVQVLRPRDRETAPPNIYSGSYGTNAFPLHTDLAHWAVPPKYLALRCVVGAPDVSTRLLDGKVLIERFGAGTLARTLVQPRRPVAGTRPLLRLLERGAAGSIRVRWDSLFNVPATAASAGVFAEVSEFLQSTCELTPVLCEPGDTLIIDNWRMLHGRAPVPPQSRSRHIERVYLNCVNVSE